jgi:hypothetical protein
MNVFAGADHQSATREDFPDGFRYEPELITPEEEIELLAHISELPLREFEFHGYKGKRRVVSFGWVERLRRRQRLHQATVRDGLVRREGGTEV